MQQNGEMATEDMLQERERIRQERHAQMLRHNEIMRERELERLTAQRLERENEEEQAKRIEEDKRRQADEEARRQAEAEQNGEGEGLSEEERRKREFWERQNAKNKEIQRLRMEKERQEQEKQRLEQEQRRKEEEEERRRQITEMAKGFEQFGEDQVYRPQGYKDQQNQNAGFNADLPRGFGSFGKEDKPPEGVAGGRGDPFGNLGGGGGGAEAPFRGKPFAPRDIRKAAGSNDLEMLADYLQQRPGWVDKTDKNEWGPIHFAAREGHAEAVQVLIQANADINVRNKQGLTPLGIAVERVGERHPLTEILRNNGAEL